MSTVSPVRLVAESLVTLTSMLELVVPLSLFSEVHPPITTSASKVKILKLVFFIIIPSSFYNINLIYLIIYDGIPIMQTNEF